MELAIAIIGVAIALIALIVQVLDYWRKQKAEHVSVSESIPVDSEHLLTKPEAAQLANLRRNLTESFDASELKNLCFDLDVDYENLAGDTKADKVRELVEYMQRRGRLPELLATSQQRRPQLTWLRVSSVPDVETNQPEPGIPHNLPRRSSFVGREAEKAKIHSALSAPDITVISICGSGGVGKSAIALSTAYDCFQASTKEIGDTGIARFAGVIWVSAKDREVDLTTLLDITATALGYPGIVQQHLEEKQQSVSAMLRANKYLLLLDNYETISDGRVRDFVDSFPGPSKVLITTREQYLERTHTILLSGLTKNETLNLIWNESERLGLKELAVTAEEALRDTNQQRDNKSPILTRLFEATGGTPLAIKWCVGQVKQRGQSLLSVVNSLESARGDSFEKLFSMYERSWELLSEDARQIMLIMPLFEAPIESISIADVSSVNSGFGKALEQCTEMWLVESVEADVFTDQRYTIHPLVRSFTSRQFREKGLDWQFAARSRFAEHFSLVAQGVRAREVDKAAWNRVGEQLPNIFAAMRWSYENSPILVIEFVKTVASYLTRQGFWDEALELGYEANKAAMTLANDEADDQLRVERQIRAGKSLVWPVSWVHRHRHEIELSEANIEEAIRIFESIDESIFSDEQKVNSIKEKKADELARAWRFLGRTYQEVFRLTKDRGQPDWAKLDQADAMFKQALEYYMQPAGKRTSLAHTWLSLARVRLDRDEYDAALEFAQMSLQLGTEIGFIEGEGASSITVGEIMLRQGKLTEARHYLLNAEQKMREVERVDGVADAVFALSQVAEQTGNSEEALRLTQQALDTYERIGQHAEAERARGLLKRLGG